MASGWVGIVSAELHFPEAHSLKEKRMYVRSAKEQLLADAERYLASREWELGQVARELVTLDDD